LVIDELYTGIPGVTLGGYVAGLAGRGLGDSVAVTLSRPVPPGSTAVLERLESETLVRTQDAVAARAVPSRFRSTAPKAVDLEAAGIASGHYPGFEHHHFPNCFCCGPDRPVGAGLRIFPGPVDGRRLVAGVWHPSASLRQPDGTVASEIVWAALDCPAIWAYIMYGDAGSEDRAVTGQLAIQLHRAIPAEAASVIVGWPIERQGRYLVAGAAIFSEAGDLLAESRQTLVLTERGVPMNREAWT
jgi:hypothetical protein